MVRKYAIENVQKSRIKVATLSNMNDPYEFYHRFEGAMGPEIEKFKSHYNTKTGFLCFTRRLGNPVQWAHYADNHHGICFEFEIPDKYLLKVNYLKSPAIISGKCVSWKQDLVKATLCKYSGWKYEREYRLLIDLESQDVVEEDGLYFARFSKEVIPSKVYTGVRCELTDEEKEVFKTNELPVFKMFQDSNSYSIVHA
jgi:hypothetical protein